MENITLTGDPFVDVGGLVVNEMPHKSIEEKIRFVTDVYVDKWTGKLHAVFLNSKITQGSRTNKPKLQKNGSLTYYGEILSGKGALVEGYCRICAKKDLLFDASRRDFPLVGSKDFVNFHHSHEKGLLLCRNCLVKLYFVPVGVLKCGGNLILLQIQNKYTAKLWQEDVIKNNLDKISKGSSGGMLSSNLLNPQNALFHFAANLIKKFDLFDIPSQRLRLFYFTNFGNKANVAIYDLPNHVFSFLKRVLKPDIKDAWSYFVKRHYRFSKKRHVHFEKGSREWVELKKKETVSLDDQEYEGTNPNWIYEHLLSGKSILRFLCRIHKTEKFPIIIAIIYLREVRKMRQEQIDLIQKISDKIIALGQKENNFKKFITPIEGARHAYELRATILRLSKSHYKEGESEPFIRLTDFVEYLFPDGQSWYEVRDFLLISLYEKLHDLRIDPAQVSDAEVSDIINKDINSLEAFNQQ